MISIRTMRGGSDAAGYYLQRSAECAAEYYFGDGEQPGRWVGRGAAVLGLTCELGADGAQVLRQLLNGIDPVSGGRGVGPVMRAHPHALLPGTDLVRAVEEATTGASSPAFAGADLADSYAELVVAVERRPAKAYVHVTKAADLAAAVGLEPADVYRTAAGTDRYAAALEYADVKVDIRNSLIDVTVSAPKSVSVLYALTDRSVAEVVRGCHERAVDTVLTYLDTVAGHGLRGHQGADRRAHRISTDGLVAAAFTHQTSRADDPQLHTHLVIPNMVKGDDGKWSAVDSRTVYRHATTASYLYHAVLRGELTRTLGVGWTRINRGIAEIEGIPKKLRKLFSTRSDQITAHRVGHGMADTPKAAQAACLATRPKKSHAAEVTLRERWRQRTNEAGFDAEHILGATLQQVASPEPPPLGPLIAALTGPDGLTRHKTSVDRRDVLQALCEAHPPGTALALRQLESLADLVMHSSEQLLALGPSRDPATPRYSTVELLASEQQALSATERLREQPAPTVHEVTVAGQLADTRLSPEQRAVVRRLVSDPRGLAVVVGPAGAGKTAALGVAHRIWATDGVPVIGTAVAALAARGLQRATGIRSDTLTRVLADLDHIDPDTGQPARLAQRSVLIVDEAGMVDTRTLARLLDHSLAAQAKLVLVGDPAQLPEIRAGGLFDVLAKDSDVLRLSSNVRQTSNWERDALTALRNGDAAAALDAYLAHDRIVLAPSAATSHQQIVDGYLSHAALGEDVLILTSTRAAAATLNDAVRARLRAQGRLGADQMTVTINDESRSFAVGDQVMITANDRRRDLLNGTRGTVMSLTPNEMRLCTSDGRQVNLDQHWVATGRLNHAYALTVHKAQGATLDAALVHGTDALTKEAGYVALSRGRVSNQLYATLDDVVNRIDGLDSDEATRIRDTVGDLAVRLTCSRRHRLATHQLVNERSLGLLEPVNPSEPQTRSVSR